MSRRSRSLFLDTGPLLAAVIPGDEHHEAARAVFERIAQREWTAVATSDYVVAEALNFLRARVRRKDAAETVLDVVFGRADAPPAVTAVARVHSTRFAASVELYRRYFERRLSFTDCTTLIVVQEEKVDDVATFDQAFRGLVNVVP